MRALQPTASGFTTNSFDGTRIAWESFEPGVTERTIVFLPTWSIVHSSIWKFQVPYFVQQGFRVITFDGRGNGRSDRPDHGYTTAHFVADTLAVFDDLAIEKAALVAFSAGARWGIQFAAEFPERVTHLAMIGPAARLDETPEALKKFLAIPPDREGFNKYTAIHWREDYSDFLQWFFTTLSNEPHSTKQIEDGVGWGLETTPDTLIATIHDRVTPNLAELAAAVRCTTLILHGDNDQIIPIELGRQLHEVIGGSTMVTLEGSGHAPHTRDPVKVNQVLHDFVGRAAPRQRRWRRAMTRPKRALFVSSPIGLGHAQRDVAIARALRAIVPGLEIDWLAQHPVTTVLSEHGECIHPASRLLAGESSHIESEMAGVHELNVFRAWRNMDEILLANFMVFLDVTRETSYDLWIGDEAWEIDYYLHENPELKTTPFAWLTDFVGWLPMPPDPDGREAALTTDYNAEMIEQVARFPYVRDAALFIGNPDDVVSDHFGEGLPRICDWVDANFEYSGYIRYFDPEVLGDRFALRAQFGFGSDETVAVAAVGGTGVGADLLRRIIDAYPIARDLVPGLRLIIVCGPRIEAAELPHHPGIEYRGYVHNLYEMLAAGDVALVQGGLATTMELVGVQRPFLYFPLTGHFEQNQHVAHRLERYGVPSWARIPFNQATPEIIAARLRRALLTPLKYQPVEAYGAQRAAEKIAALL